MPNVSAILGGVIVVLLVIIGGQQMRIQSRDAQIATMRAEYAEQSAQAQKQARETEQKWQSIAEKEVQDARNQQSIAESAAADAAANADSLRAEVRRLRSRIATNDATAAGRSTAEQSAFGVLADLFDESVRRNQVLAAEADAARNRGMTCERIYDGAANESAKRN